MMREGKQLYINQKRRYILTCKKSYITEGNDKFKVVVEGIVILKLKFIILFLNDVFSAIFVLILWLILFDSILLNRGDHSFNHDATNLIYHKEETQILAK